MRTRYNVRNTVFTRNEETGRYELNEFDAASPDPTKGFPEQTTFDEWAASEYARYRRVRVAVRPQPADRLHLPGLPHAARQRSRRAYRPAARRPSTPRHDHANTFVPTIIPHHPCSSRGGRRALEAGKARAVDMLRRAATLQVALADGALSVRVGTSRASCRPPATPKGRRMWLQVRAPRPEPPSSSPAATCSTPRSSTTPRSTSGRRSRRGSTRSSPLRSRPPGRKSRTSCSTTWC